MRSRFRPSHRSSLTSDSASWSGTFLAARDALAQVATEASAAAAQLREWVAILNPAAASANSSPTSAANPAAVAPKPAGAPSTARENPSLVDSLPTELGAQTRNWDCLGDRSAKVLAGGVASGVHAVSVELTNAIFVTGQWGEAFVKAGERVVQQLIEVAAQALLVRTVVSVGLGGLFGLASGSASLPASGAAHFASGGLNLDTLPALLSPGEAVIRSSAVRELGPSFLAGINSGIVDLDRLGSPTAVVSPRAGMAAPPGSGPDSRGFSAPHFHFAFHDDGAGARRYLSGVEGRKFLVDTSRQTVHEVTGRS